VVAVAAGSAGAVVTTVVEVEDHPVVVDSEGVVVTTVAVVAAAVADSVDEVVEADSVDGVDINFSSSCWIIRVVSAGITHQILIEFHVLFCYNCATYFFFEFE
jgi:hypothetical protein